MIIVYVVTSTEDGILGVYSSKQGAYNEALNYVNSCLEGREVISYEEVCVVLKDVYNYGIELCECNSGINSSIYAVESNRLETRHFIPFVNNDTDTKCIKCGDSFNKLHGDIDKKTCMTCILKVEDPEAISPELADNDNFVTEEELTDMLDDKEGYLNV